MLCSTTDLAPITNRNVAGNRLRLWVGHPLCLGNIMFNFSFPAVPHRLTQDDEYMGYTLPAGTIVIGNAW